MEHEEGNAGDFQRSTRMPLDAVVRLHFEGTVAYQNGFAANVSATGMFVKHPSPPPVGTPLVFEFNRRPAAKARPGLGRGASGFATAISGRDSRPASGSVSRSSTRTAATTSPRRCSSSSSARSPRTAYLDPQRLAGPDRRRAVVDRGPRRRRSRRAAAADRPRERACAAGLRVWTRVEDEPLPFEPPAGGDVPPRPTGSRSPSSRRSTTPTRRPRRSCVKRCATSPTATLPRRGAATPERSGIPPAVWAIVGLAVLAGRRVVRLAALRPGREERRGAGSRARTSMEPEPPKPEPLSAEPGPGHARRNRRRRPERALARRRSCRPPAPARRGRSLPTSKGRRRGDGRRADRGAPCPAACRRAGSRRASDAPPASRGALRRRTPPLPRRRLARLEITASADGSRARDRRRWLPFRSAASATRRSVVRLRACW